VGVGLWFACVVASVERVEASLTCRGELWLFYTGAV
jgi:hypothetical protein